MAFASMFIVFTLFVVIVVALVFFIGLAIFIVGLANKRKIKRSHKKWPIVLMSVGGFIMTGPIVLTLLVTIGIIHLDLNAQSALERYGNVSEAWYEGEVGSVEVAGQQALKVLFEAADDNDRREFKKNFAEDVRNREGFDEAVDQFFDTYPGGFSNVQLTYDFKGNQNPYKGARGARRRYSCDIDGTHYYVVVGFAYGGKDPRLIGVNYLTVFNIGGQAEFHYGQSDINEKNEDLYLLCYLPGPDEVNARRINRYCYLWNESDGPVLTADEMRDYLEKFTTLQEAIDAGGIGHPNVIPVEDGFVMEWVFYELKSDGPEPLYMEIRSNDTLGEIKQAWTCTETNQDVNNMLIDRG